MTQMTDRLMTAKQIAGLMGYEPEQYKSVYARLERAGIEPWRDPDNSSSRTVRWWESDILGYLRRGGGGAVAREKQPESKPSRFRKAS